MSRDYIQCYRIQNRSTRIGTADQQQGRTMRFGQSLTFSFASLVRSHRDKSHDVLPLLTECALCLNNLYSTKHRASSKCKQTALGGGGFAFLYFTLGLTFSATAACPNSGNVLPTINPSGSTIDTGVGDCILATSVNAGTINVEGVSTLDILNAGTIVHNFGIIQTNSGGTIRVDLGAFIDSGGGGFIGLISNSGQGSSFTINQGDLSNIGTLVNSTQAQFTISPLSSVSNFGSSINSARLDNNGVIRNTGALAFFNNNASGVINNSNLFINNGGRVGNNSTSINSRGLIMNSGTIENVNKELDTMSIFTTSGTIHNDGKISNNAEKGEARFVVATRGIVDGTGTYTQKGAGAVTKILGTQAVQGLMDLPTIGILGGTLGGGGRIHTTFVKDITPDPSCPTTNGLTVCNATVNVGDPQTLTIEGSLILANSTLEISVAGTGPGQTDFLDIIGNAFFVGIDTFKFDFINGFLPQAGDLFEFMNVSDGVDTSALLGLDILYEGVGPGFDTTLLFDPETRSFTLRADNNATVREPSSIWPMAAALIAFGLLAARPMRRSAPTAIIANSERKFGYAARPYTTPAGLLPEMGLAAAVRHPMKSAKRPEFRFGRQPSYTRRAAETVGKGDGKA